MVRGAILAEWSNSGAGSGLLGKIEIGEKKGGFWGVFWEREAWGKEGRAEEVAFRTFR